MCASATPSAPTLRLSASSTCSARLGEEASVERRGGRLPWAAGDGGCCGWVADEGAAAQLTRRLVSQPAEWDGKDPWGVGGAGMGGLLVLVAGRMGGACAAGKWAEEGAGKLLELVQPRLGRGAVPGAAACPAMLLPRAKGRCSAGV